MARCDVCGKGPLSGNNVSHSNKKTKTRWQPNVQKMKVLYNGKIERLWVCTSCLKSGKVQKVI